MKSGRACVTGILAGVLQAVAVAGVLAMAGNSHGAESAAQLRESARALYKGDNADAALLARRYIEIHPQDPAGRILLARAEVAQGSYRQAYQELRKALRADPKNIDALYYLGQVTKTLGRLEYERLFAMAPDAARTHQFLAESYVAEGNSAKAKEEYAAVLKAEPGSVEVLCALGDVERLDLRFDSAISYYGRALQIAPNEYCGVYGLGVSYLRRHEVGRAVEYFRRAVILSPNSGVTRLALGSALLQNGDAAAAVTELKAAVADQPDLRQAYALLARGYRTLGQFQKAEESLKRARALEAREHEFLNKALILDDLAPEPPLEAAPGAPPS